MASTTLYCSRADLTDRLSDGGVDFVADDDGDGAVTEAEKVATLDRAIVAAGAVIDQALCPWINTLPVTQDDGSRNETLKLIAVDLASERLAARAGGTVPSAFTEAAVEAKERLERVRMGEERVCGLVYPTDGFETERRRLGSPKVANPFPTYGRRR